MMMETRHQNLYAEQHMARKLNWQKAWLDQKLKLSIKDEKEFVDRDLASRWLERAEAWERRRKKWRQRRKQRERR
jgi:hypothetical protein